MQCDSIRARGPCTTLHSPQWDQVLARKMLNAKCWVFGLMLMTKRYLFEKFSEYGGTGYPKFREANFTFLVTLPSPTHDCYWLLGRRSFCGRSEVVCESSESIHQFQDYYSVFRIALPLQTTSLICASISCPVCSPYSGIQKNWKWLLIVVGDLKGSGWFRAISTRKYKSSVTQSSFTAKSAFSRARMTTGFYQINTV